MKAKELTDCITENLLAAMRSYPEDSSQTLADRADGLAAHIVQSEQWPGIEAALKERQKMGYHEQPEVIQLHRVIGGYIDVFSQLTAIARQQTMSYFADLDKPFPVRHAPLLDALFASMTAKPIMEAFFGLATLVGELDEAEIAVRNTLRRKVQEHVSFRNDLVHADWSIGWVNDDTDEDIPASAHKIKTKNGVPTMTELGITTNEIISRINDLQGLYRQVNVFGTACRARQRGEGRVSDVLEAVPASAGGGTVIREVKR